MFYVPFGSEVDTYGMIRDSIKLGKDVLVPAMEERSDDIIPVQISGISDLAKGKWGIPEPKVKNKFPLGRINLIIVPGVAFDRHCYRIGFGKGCYDRFLKKTREYGKAFKLGIGYGIQLLDSVPHSGQDVRLDAILTEKGVVRKQV